MGESCSTTARVSSTSFHLSQHTGGFVIARGKLSRLVPIDNALALGILSAIRRALDLVSQQRGEPFEMQDIPLLSISPICWAGLQRPLATFTDRGAFMIRIGRTQGRSGRCFECRGSVEMEWTPPSLRGSGHD
jgi:hypothetical protein